MLVVGIDEAGRGPCIGPLVTCGAMMKEKDIPKLIALDVKDSKLLTIKQRDFLFDELKKLVKYKILIVKPAEIDDAVNGKGGLNLNWLEARKSAEIINFLKPNKAILDCPSPNIQKYTEYVENLLTVKVKVICEHKADLNYPIVSAASIIAKVTRDREIEKIKKEIGIDFGSGYPADPRTKEFLKKY